MKSKKYLLGILIASAAITGCQKMTKPSLGQYPTDANPPGGPLSFYVAFDGSTDNSLRNAVDSVRANFASDNPLTTADGVNGKGIQGANAKFIKYTKPNDWASKAQSFTISFWYKKDGQTQNSIGGNGPEHVITLKSSNGHWSGSQMLVFLEGNNTGCAVKTMFVDSSKADNWFTWEGGNTIPGLANNNWHHIALVYAATNSTMTLYVDGVANPNTRTWGTHGGLHMDNSTITEMRIGGGPNDGFSTDDWLSGTFKGSLDQIRMYTKDLSAAEVQELFAKKQ